MDDWVVTEELLKSIEKWDSKPLGKEYRTRPLSMELKKERVRVLNLVWDWLYTYYMPDVLHKIKELRGDEKE